MSPVQEHLTNIAPDHGPTRHIAWRLTALSVIFAFLAAFVVWKAGWLQLMRGEHLRELAAEQQSTEQAIQVIRGNILDKDGNIIVKTVRVPMVVADPKTLRSEYQACVEQKARYKSKEISRVCYDVDTAADKLVEILQMPKAEIVEMLSRDKNYQVIKRNINTPQREELEKLQGTLKTRIPGIRVEDEPHRAYPNGTLATQLIGTVPVLDVDRKKTLGSGVEGAFDNHLTSIEEKVFQRIQDGKRRALVDDSIDFDDLKNNNVQLTLDSDLQVHVEKMLQEGVINTNANYGFAIVVDPKTGAVLSMANYTNLNSEKNRALLAGSLDNASNNQRSDAASLLRTQNAPQFDPVATADALQDGATWPLPLRLNPQNGERNYAVSEQFEPGSIFKIATFAAALDAGSVRPESGIDCENGVLRIGRHTIRDYKHRFQTISASSIFHRSSNIGTAKIALELGPERFVEAMDRFGFGKSTGLGLREESRGFVNTQKLAKGGIHLATGAFGHGLRVTGMQMIDLVSAIANHGTLYPAHVVGQITSPDGEIVQDLRPAPRQVLRPEAAQALTNIMVGVTEEVGGTGHSAAIPGIHVAGKTGTAEKIDPQTRHYSHLLNVSSFAGFAPAENASVVALVVLDEPHGEVTDGVNSGATGGLVAAPIWREIVKYALQKRGVIAESTVPALTAEDIQRLVKAGRLPRDGFDGVFVQNGGASASALPATTQQRQNARNGNHDNNRGGNHDGSAVFADGDDTDAPLDLVDQNDINPQNGQNPTAATPFDAMGLSLRRALALAKERNVVVTVTGSGTVIAQNPPAGTPIPSGGAVQLTLGQSSGQPAASSSGRLLGQADNH